MKVLQSPLPCHVKVCFSRKDLNQLDLVNKMSLILGAKGIKLGMLQKMGVKRSLFCFVWM
jgi:hypothetical protein